MVKRESGPLLRMPSTTPRYVSTSLDVRCVTICCAITWSNAVKVKSEFHAPQLAPHPPRTTTAFLLLLLSAHLDLHGVPRAEVGDGLLRVRLQALGVLRLPQRRQQGRGSVGFLDGGMGA